MRSSVLALLGANMAIAAVPEQIHLSLTGKAGEMAVDFVAQSDNQAIKLGTTTFAAECQQLTLNKYQAFFCNGLMTGLSPATQYAYSVGSDSTGWSSTYNFVNEPNARPPIAAIYADFGLTNEESLKALIADHQANGFDYVIHAGDFAYDLDSSSSAVGNGFMNSLQPYAAEVPYMSVPGNHEAYGTQGGADFNQFIPRFQGTAANAGKNCGSNSNLFYSFNTPLVHWLGFTAETWTMTDAQISSQQAFIDADLSAVDHTNTPWVVAYSHKAFQMDQTNWTLFNFLADYNVDLQFVGHWHQYTRFPPLDTRDETNVITDWAAMSNNNNTYTNAKYPITIVAGAPGDQELNPPTCKEEYEINCSGNYGYGWFQALNATHAHWLWNTTVPVKGSPNPTFYDDVWIVKN